ncbi:class I SAM-dependent methyltransferase [Fulvivirgaceae bacterium BMA10]|uniref:Class I SAM-dependent methyltransferase n=1 Tax=Splendidivirga corallicola TaxID=3051826 RepID=A0ABT8KUK8_9BACT|nr:class I SAM-dependent methyltransferase [Fulvivirgaceae bacterium BMA10]
MRRASLIISILLLLGCNDQNKSGNNNGAAQDSTKADQSNTLKDQNNSTQNANNFSNLVEEYEDPNRVRWQNPDLVIQKMGSLRGKTLADIGAGSGYFSFRLINMAEKVIAIDIDKRFLDYIEERKSGLNTAIASRLVTRLTDPDDPKLDPGEVDIVLVVNTYANIENRKDYFEKVRIGLKDNGKLVIVDFKFGDIPAGPPDEFKVNPEDAKNELRAAGFDNIQIDDTSLEFQYIIIAE